MDSFEALIRLLLERDGYWTRQSQKVGLSKAHKRELGKPSMPRVEIDVIAFNPRDDEILAMEVKSYMDSTGVQARLLQEEFDKPNGVYKILTCRRYRELIEETMLADYRKQGLATPQTTIRWGLAAGKVKKNDTAALQAHFKSREWVLWTPEIVAEKARALAKIGYENDPFVILSKLLVRN